MSLIDKSGMFLEGIRVATGNNGFTFPPRNFVLSDNESDFQSVTSRAEYVLLADSLDPDDLELDIGSPNLVFRWTRNEPGATRFDWDGFSRRWLPSPGSRPDAIGVISNDPRLAGSVPDPSMSSAPFSFYVGNPTRLVTFDVEVVSSESSFTSLAPGRLQVAKDTGSLNFSDSDVASYAGQTVYGQRQNFFDRTKRKGSIGPLPPTSELPYFLFLNPLPAHGQVPRVRLGYGRHLQAVEVPDESSLGSPPPGTFTWSRDTGRLQFSASDVASNLEENVYYDGVIVDSFQLDRTLVGPIVVGFPIPGFFIPGLVGLSLDQSQRYVVFAEAPGLPRSYFPMSLFDSSDSFPTDGPSSGYVFGDVASGAVFFSPDDILLYLGRTISYVRTAHSVERGVTFQMFQSGVNGSGEENASDFSILYRVDRQIVVDDIGGAPFVMLPTVPVVDSNLHFYVQSGSGSTGTFNGELKDGTDPSKQGFGYLLDLDSKQMKFCFRKTVERTLAKDSPVVKLDDGAISKKGFEAFLNGTPIVPGVDFTFDEDTGLVEFIDPVGEDDPGNVFGITGTIVLPDTFVSDSPGVFQSSHVGSSLFFPSGDNAGIYKIASVQSSQRVSVSVPFSVSGADVADLRISQEVVADRFWTDFKPRMKKFSLSKAPSPAGPYVLLDESEYSVIAETGQVNLTNPAKPGQSFQIDYIFLSSPDNINFTPIPKTEKALFKIRQEAGVTTPGSNDVLFNPDGDVVSLDRAIQVAINGFTQDSVNFTFVPPGTLKLAQPVQDGDSVIIDYWVENSPGGNTNFNLLFSPLDLDPPQILQGSSTAAFNGDQRGTVSPGSAFMSGDKDLTIVQTVSYDPSQDVTNVTFENPALADSAGTAILVSQPVSGDYRIAETAPSDSFTKGTNFVVLTGLLPYRIGTIVTVDGDPYYAISVKKDVSTNTTKVTFASPAVRNYVIPSLTRTVRPVLKPDGKFQTDRPLNADFPVTLVRMGPDRAVLVKDVDYTVAEGGIVQLNTDAKFGDSLHAMYVARVSKPAGTKFTFNYAHAIAPSESNGILSQQLAASYTLYAPDSFFYRVESFSTFLPEVQDLLRQSAQSGGSSGPDTSSRSSMKPKDFGSPSLFFPEQHYSNVDEIVIRLLKYYNDLVNAYEDVLANLDGRVVGGTDGRFKFDGITDNPPRDDRTSVTNDVDDQIKLYDFFAITDFFVFELVPFYGYMGGVNRFSRLFPTLTVATAVINDKVTFDDLGETMGSLQILGNPVGNIRSLFGLTSSLSNEVFTSTASGGTVLVLPQNGSPKSLTPPFESGQPVHVFSRDGSPGVNTKISSISGSGPFNVTLEDSTDFSSGSVQHSTNDPDDTTVHYYVNGRDLVVDFDSGELKNQAFPPPLDELQNAPTGNEVLEGLVFYVPQNTKALRIPALDGKEFLDDGRVSRPQAKYGSETGLLALEASALDSFGTAKVTPDKFTLAGLQFSVAVGDTVRFTDGPNAGLDRKISSVIGSGSAKVAAAFDSTDPSGSSLIKVSADGTALPGIVADELGVMLSNNPASPSPGAVVGKVQSGLSAADDIVRSLGPEGPSGTGTASGSVLTDGSGDFSGVGKTDVLYVPSGPNFGVYKIVSSSSSSLTVSSDSPFYPFPSSGSTPYVVIKKYSFLGPKGPQFLAEYFQKTLAFLGLTQSWALSLDPAGASARQASVAQRLTDVTGLVKKAEGVLKGGDKLYDVRFLWLDQRVNRKTGSLTQLKQASDTRAESLEKLLEDQQKLLISQALSG